MPPTPSSARLKLDASKRSPSPPLLALAATLILASACGSASPTSPVDAGAETSASGGATGSGGAGSGGTVGTGGVSATGGANASGGVTGSGGQGGRGASGGLSSSGGASTGGKSGGNSGGGAGGKAGAGGVGATGGSGPGGRAGGGAGGAISTGGTAGTSAAGGPCDLYAAGNTPCVAAHSTVRALSSAYTGNLYQVRRASDKTTKDIGPLARGGFADSAAQDTFCAGTTCTFSILYDQSSKGNHLTVAPKGGNGKADTEASATALKLTVGGHPVYALFIAPGNGYRNNQTTGIATGNDPEGLYMVTSGTHVNSGCCFDYGNAETSSNDTGNGHMEAIYIGNLCWFTPCNGSGPWVMADLENGLFSGGNGASNSNTSVPYDYVTAMVKGQSTGYAIKAGNGQSGALKTMYDGKLPTTTGYNPMHKEGAIILGIGGDNSNVSAGTFFEGAMTAGFPTDATDDAVQANVVAAGYGN